MLDAGLIAFSVFFTQMPSFLAHQRKLADTKGLSNAQPLFGVHQIPSDNHIRDLLDGVSYRLPYSILFSIRLLKSGETRYFHTVVTLVLACSGRAEVIPLVPEFVMPQDGYDKLWLRKCCCQTLVCTTQ